MFEDLFVDRLVNDVQDGDSSGEKLKKFRRKTETDRRLPRANLHRKHWTLEKRQCTGGKRRTRIAVKSKR